MQEPALSPDELVAEIEGLRQLVHEQNEALEAWMAAEAEWSRNKHFFRVITDNVKDLIAVIDRQGHRLWNNPAYSRLLGYTAEELSGSYSMSEVHPDDQAKVMQAFHAIIETGRGQTIEYRMKHKNGSWVMLESQSAAVIDRDGNFESMVLIARDISRRKEMEGSADKVKKLEYASVLAQGVAREINEVMTQILGQVSAAKAASQPQTVIGQRLVEIERGTQKAHEIGERLLTIAHQENVQKVSTRLGPLLQDVANSVVRGSMVRAEYTFPSDLPDVEVELEAFRHAVHNVIANAFQAMQKGVIRISARLILVGENQQRGTMGLMPGTYIRIDFHDQGAGMTERTLGRAFEPYFTTRENARGLGLTTALAIVQRHGGTMSLESVLGVGTTVTMLLPISGNVAVIEKEERKSQPINLTQKPHVLLMDDDQMILDIVGNMLRHLGYEVNVVKDGAQAIAQYMKAKAQKQPYGIVIMDLVIPNGVGGQDAVHTLRGINPNVKCIASSGHSDHPVMKDYRKYGFCAAIPKPYKLEILQQALEATLANPPPPRVG